MTMKRLIAAALLGMAPAATAADPVSLLPEDTLVCVSVTRPEKLAALAEHPVAKAVKMGRLKELFGKAMDALGDGKASKVWQEECGMAPGEVFAKFSGSMAFGVFDAQLKADFEEGQQPVELGLAAAFDGDEGLVAGVMKALAKLEAGEDGTGEDASELGQLLQAKERTEEADGVTIHVLEADALAEVSLDAIAWCVRDKMLIMATGEKQLRAMLERAAAGKTEGTFAASGTWKSAREGTDDADFLLAFDFSRVVKLAIADTRGASFFAIMKALDLDRIKTIAFGLRHDAQAIEFKVHVPCESVPWMLDYMKRAPGSEAPKFFPNNLTSASWTPVDFGALAEGILDKLPEVFPPAKAQLESGLAGLKAATGVDIEKEILQQLGTGYFQVTRTLEKLSGDDLASAPDTGNFINIVVPAKEGAVLGVKLKDAKVVDAALRSLAEKMFKGKVDLDAREYMGWKIHAVKLPPPSAAEDAEDGDAAPEVKPLTLTLTIADDWLLLGVGRQEVLESVLGGLKHPPAEHFWARPDIQKGLAAMPGGENYASFDDLSMVGPVAAVGLAGALSILPGMDFLDAIEMDDIEAMLKTVEFPLHAFEKYHLERDSISSTARLVPAPGAE